MERVGVTRIEIGSDHEQPPATLVFGGDIRKQLPRHVLVDGGWVGYGGF